MCTWTPAWKDYFDTNCTCFVRALILKSLEPRLTSGVYLIKRPQSDPVRGCRASVRRSDSQRHHAFFEFQGLPGWWRGSREEVAPSFSAESRVTKKRRWLCVCVCVCVCGVRGGDKGTLMTRSPSESMSKLKYGGVEADTKTQKLAELLQANMSVCSSLYTLVTPLAVIIATLKKQTNKQKNSCWMRKQRLSYVCSFHVWFERREKCSSAGRSFMSACTFDCFRRGGQRVSRCPPPATRLASCMTPYSLR